MPLFKHFWSSGKNIKVDLKFFAWSWNQFVNTFEKQKSTSLSYYLRTSYEWNGEKNESFKIQICAVLLALSVNLSCFILCFFFVWKFLLKIIQSIQHKTIFTKMLKLKINCRKTVKVIDGFRHSPFTSPRSFSFLQNLSIITIFIRLP